MGNTKYDIVLREKPGNEGLTRNDVIDLFDILSDTEAYPIEIVATEHECSAMGFISPNAAERLDYNYRKSGLNGFIANILDDMEKESDDCTYEFMGIKIWLSR